MSERARILLIEDNPADVDLVREALPDAGAASFLVESAPRLSVALARLEAGGIDLVLLDLSLPDSLGLDTLRKTRDAAPNVPVIVLTGNDDQAIGLAAVSAGAQDYLVKGEVTGNSLARSLRHAIARRRAEEALKESEFRYRQLVENLNEGIWMIDEQAVTTFVNPHMAKMLGYTVEEMLGRHLFSFMDAQAAQSATLNLARRRQGISEQHDFEFLRKDGTRVYASVGTAPITDLGGKYRGAIAGVSNLTERKLAEEALQESEGKFRTMAEQTADLIALTDTDGVITYASAASVSLFHCTPEEMCGRPFMEFLDESAIPNATAAFRSALSRGERTRDLVLTMKRHDGTLFVGELSGSDFRSGTQSGTLVIIRDITARKQAEVALTESYDLLANLARLVPGVVYQYRLYPDGRSAFPYSSPGMYDIYEVTPEEVREDAAPVFGRLHPDDYDRVSDSIQESARTLQTFYCEFRVILPQQGLRWRWSQAQPQRMEDGGTLWHGIISDITERKQAEEALSRSETMFRSLFESMAEGAALHEIVYGADGKAVDYRIVDVNPGYEVQTGITPERARGHLATEVYMTDAAPYLDIYERVARTGEPHSFETRYPPLDKSFAISAYSPKRGWFATVFADITERARREREVADARALLQASIESPKGLVIMAVDREYRYLCFNATHAAAMQSAYGKDAAIGMNVLDCISSAVDRQNAKTNYDRAMAGEPHSTVQEYGDIEKSYYETFYNPIFDDRNEVIGITAFARDITERMQAEERLKSQLEELRRWEEVMLDREDRVREIKCEVNELCRRAGEPVRYPSQTANSADSGETSA